MFFSKIKSFISIFIITLLVLGLVLSLGVGTDIVSFGMSDKIIAKVNKEEITLEEFNYFRGLRFSELPKEVLSDKDSIRIIDREIVNTIARRKVSAFEAKKLGLFVSDIEIKNKIKNTNLFNRNGQFIGFEEYQLRVKDIFGLGTDIFEQILREEALAEKLEFFFSSFVSVSDNEIKSKYIDDFTKLNFYIIRPKSTNYKLPTFSNDEVDNYIKEEVAKFSDEPVSFRTAILDYNDITVDIDITKKDIDTFILNYSSNQENLTDEKAKVLIRKRIALNIFPEKLEYLTKLSQNKNFEDIINQLGISEEPNNINIQSSEILLPQDLINQIQAAKFENKKPKVFYASDAIWIISRTSKNIYSKEEALESLKSQHLTRYKIQLLEKLLAESQQNDKLIFESIKASSDFSYEFNYDINFADFSGVTNDKVGYKSLKEEEFIPFIINIESENFIIFIEKIRKANSDFLLLDKDKIKKDLSIPRKKKIYGVFLSEIYNSSTIEYNTKYIN